MKPRCRYTLLLTCLLIPNLALATGSVEFSGFARGVAGHVTASDGEFGDYDNDWSLKPNSLLGLQVDWQISSDFSATVQGLVQSNVSRDSGIEWAYVSYNPDTPFQAKAGQLRTPFFSYSDVLDVGYAYPWIMAPTEVYASFFFTQYDGLDLSYQFSGENYSLSFEGFAGSYDGDVDNIKGGVDDIAGGIALLHTGNWQFRAAFTKGDIFSENLDIAMLSSALKQAGFISQSEIIGIEGTIDFVQIGVQYENIDYFVNSEWIRMSHDIALIPEVTSYYFTAGYRFSDYTLHLTYADRKDTLQNIAPIVEAPNSPLFGLAYGFNQFIGALNPDGQQSWTLGFRWDFMSKMAFKAEIKNTKQDAYNTLGVNPEYPTFDGKTNLVLVGLEWVF